MKKFYTSICLFVAAFSSFSQATYTANGTSGDWTDPTVWSVSGTDSDADAWPDSNDDVVMPSIAAGAYTITINGTTEGASSLSMGSASNGTDDDVFLVVQENTGVFGSLAVGGTITITGGNSRHDYRLTVNDGCSLNGNNFTMTAGTTNSRDCELFLNGGDAVFTGNINATGNNNQTYFDLNGDATLTVAGTFIGHRDALQAEDGTLVEYQSDADVYFDNFGAVTFSATSGTNTYVSTGVMNIDGVLTVGSVASVDFSGEDVDLASDLIVRSTATNPLICVGNTFNINLNGTCTFDYDHASNIVEFNDLSVTGGNNSAIDFIDGQFTVNGNLLVDGSGTNHDLRMSDPGVILNVVGTTTIEATTGSNSQSQFEISGGTFNGSDLILTNAGNDARDARLIISGACDINLSGSLIMQGSSLGNRVDIPNADVDIFIGGNLTGGEVNTTAGAAASGASITFNGASTHTVGGVNTIAGGGVGYDFPELIISGSNITTLAADLIVEGGVTLNSTGSLDVGASGPFSLSLDGDWDNSSGAADPFVERTGTVTFDGGVDQNYKGTNTTETFADLVVTSGATNFIIAAGYTINATNTDVTSDGEINYSGSLFNTSTLDIADAGSRFTASSDNLQVTGDLNITNLGKLDVEVATTSVIGGTTNITGPPAANGYSGLDLNGGMLIFNGDINMFEGAVGNTNRDARMLIQGGGADVNGNIFMNTLKSNGYIEFNGVGTLSCSGNIEGGDIKYTSGDGILRMDGSAAQTLGGNDGGSLQDGDDYEVFDLITESSSVTSLGGNLVCSGAVNILATSSLDVSTSNFSINVADEWLNSSTTNPSFIPQSGTVTFNGGDAQSISGMTSETFNNVDITTASDVSVGAGITINTNVTSLSGSSSLAFAGNAFSANTTTTNSSTITNTGTTFTSPQINVTGGGVFNHNAGTLSAVTNISIDGNSSVFNDDGGVTAGSLTIGATNGRESYYNHIAGTSAISGNSSLTGSSSTNNTNSGIVVTAGIMNLNNVFMFEGTVADLDRDTYLRLEGGTTNVDGDIHMNTLNGNGYIMFAGGTMTTAGDIEGGDIKVTSALANLVMDGAGVQILGGDQSGALQAGADYRVDNLTVTGTSQTQLGAALDINEDLSITSNGSLDVTASNFSINIQGDWNNDSGAGDPFVQQNGTVTFDGATTQTINDDEDYYNVVVTGSPTQLEITGRTINANDITTSSSGRFKVYAGSTVTAPTVNVGAGNSEVSGAAAVLNATTLNIDGGGIAFTIGANGTVTTTTTNSVDGSDINFGGTSFTGTDLNITSPTAGGSLVTATSSGINFTNLNINGRNSDFNMNGTGTTSTFTNVTIDGPTTTANNTLITTDGEIDVLANVVLNEGTADNRDSRITLAGGNLDVEGNIIMNGVSARTWIDINADGNINCAGNLEGGDIDIDGAATGAEIHMDGNGAQQLGGLVTSTKGGSGYEIYDLYIDGNNAASVTTLGTDIDIKGDIFIQNLATLDVDAANDFAITIDGDWTNASTTTPSFQPRAGTVTFDGLTTQNILSDETFNDVVMTGSPTQVEMTGVTVGAVNVTTSTSGRFKVFANATLNATTVNVGAGNSEVSGASSNLNCTTLNVTSGGHTFTVGANGSVAATTTNLLEGSDIDYGGSSYTGTDLNLTSLASGTGEFTATTGGISLVNMTISGLNSDYIQTGGTNTFTGTISVTGNLDAGTGSSRDNKVDVQGGTLVVNEIELYDGHEGDQDARLVMGDGNVDVSGNIQMDGTEARTQIRWEGSGNINIEGDIEGGDIVQIAGATGGITMDGGAAQVLGGDNGGSLIDGTGYVINDLTITNASATLMGANFQVDNFLISGSGTFDHDAAGNYTMTVLNDFTIDAAHTLGAGGDPYFERTLGRVNMSGTVLQTIDNGLDTEITFAEINMNNTSGLDPAIVSNEELKMGEFDMSNNCILEMNGNDIILTGIATQTSAMTSGTIKTSVAGTSFTFNDPTRNDVANNAHILTFGNSTGAQTLLVGDATNTIDMTGTNIGRVNFNGMELHGNQSWIMDYPSTGNECRGGNIFHGSSYFETTPTSDRWRLGDTYPDIWNGTLTVLHNGVISNFILGRGSVGNEYHDDVILESGSSAGLYVGRNNMSNGSNTHLFDGLNLTLKLNQNGTLFIGNGDANDISSVTLDNCVIDVEMASTATGTINIGQEDAFTDVVLTGTSHFANSAGDCEGTGTIRMRHITQTGSTANTLFVGDDASSDKAARIEFGTSATAGTGFPNIWEGAWTAETAAYRSFYGNVFNGTPNSFTHSGEINNSISNGGNSSAAGTSTTFIVNNTNARTFRLGGNATAGPNDWDGDVTFVEANGNMQPCYSENSTFAGNISTAGSATVVRFCENGSTMIIDGSAVQSWAGDATTDAVVENLSMQNTSSGSGLTLTDKVVLETQLSLLDGVITTSSGAELEMIAGSSMDVANSGSDASYVDGPLRKIGNTSFQFPVGGGGFYSPVLLSGMNGGVADVFTAEYHDATHPDLTVLAPLHHVSSVEYWDITPTGHTQANITLNWHDDLRSGVDNCTDLVMAHYDGADWEDIGNDACALGGDVTVNNNTDFSPFTLGSTLDSWTVNPLPIELTYFNAVPNEDQVDLSWETVSEINNEFFLLEKSLNGDEWIEVTTQDGAGNSSETIQYEDVDTNPFIGTSYYRLKQVDFDGEFTYSNVVKVNIEDAIGFELYPNPTSKEDVNIGLTGFENEEVVVIIRDIQGKEYYNNTFGIENVNETKSLNIHKYLAEGIYMVSISGENKMFTEKLIIK